MARQKIHLAGTFRQIELPAAAAILPGNLIETTSANALQKHATAGGFAEVIFAQEDALQGKTVDDAYAADDPVTAYILPPGSLTLARLLAGHNYTPATKLISDGAGRLKPTTGSPTKIIGSPIRAVDLSASGAVDTLVEIRVW